MRVLDITQVKLERLDFARFANHPNPEDYVVPPGTVGAAAVVRAIAKKLGKFTKDDERDEIPLRVLIGMGWEWAASRLYTQMHWQPGVIELGKISGHPDGFSMLGTRHMIDEFKYTAKSIRQPGAKEDVWKDIRDEWIWHCQVMAYAKMYSEILGAPVLLGRFHVCWAMGNYTKFTLDEHYMRYVVEYEQDELDRNWKMLEDNAYLVEAA